MSCRDKPPDVQYAVKVIPASYLLIIINIIDEYLEAGPWPLFPSNMSILHLNYNKHLASAITTL